MFLAATSSTCCAYAAGTPVGRRRWCCRSPWPSHGFGLVSTGLAATRSSSPRLTTTALDPPAVLRDAGCSRRRSVRSSWPSAPSVIRPIVAVALLLTKKTAFTTLLLLISSRWRSHCVARPGPAATCRVDLRRNLHSSASSRSGLAAADPVARLSRLPARPRRSARRFRRGIVVRLFTEGSKAQSCAASSKPSGTGSWSDLLHRERDALRPQVFDGPAERAAACPLFLALMLVVRGTPASALPKGAAAQPTGAARLFSATALRSSSSSPPSGRRGRIRPRTPQLSLRRASCRVALPGLGSVGCAQRALRSSTKRRPMRCIGQRLDRHAATDALGAP